MTKLSAAAKSLWAKKSNRDNCFKWLPLEIHLLDSAGVAEKLWHQWLSGGIKEIIAADAGGESEAESLFIFLAAMHDLGKATPVFQSKPAYPFCPEEDEAINARLAAAGLAVKSYKEFSGGSKTPHALAAQTLLENAGFNRSIATIIGAHHGRPPTHEALIAATVEAYPLNYNLEETGTGPWQTVQSELITFALARASFSNPRELPAVGMATQVLLSGALIMTDWIASNESFFPYIEPGEELSEVEMKKRAGRAWSRLSLPVPWAAGNIWMSTDLYGERFTAGAAVFNPRNFQIAAAEAASDIKKPGIMVLEAPMGSGKTEAALVCAEILANKSGRSGVYFALPTQATADGIFPRITSWTKKLDQYGGYSIQLAHGKAQFNEELESLKALKGSTNIGVDSEGDGSIVVHEWFEGQKKTLLADFVAGTIDQLLLAGLKQKHLMLRHLGLAGKVVIIDECHAYDAYMSQYLYRVLNWLGAYNVPVIILSATLPAQKRKAVIEAYLDLKSSADRQSDPLAKNKAEKAATEPDWSKSLDYPLITCTDGAMVNQKTAQKDGTSRDVGLGVIEEEKLAEKLEEHLSDGGCAGVVVNTVKRAQKIAQVLRGHFGEDVVNLLHSRFLALDRAEKEQCLLSELGKPGHSQTRPAKRIVVGTQVLEQSLDIDFDLLVTDFCPMDLLLQRIGRLHRHQRIRPPGLKAARALIMGTGNDEYEAGTRSIYGDYLLMRTEALLPQESIQIPDDIPELVQNTYDARVDPAPEPPGYREAEKVQNALITSKESRAKSFRIAPVWPGKRQNMVNWLDIDISSKMGEAAVRDTDETLEVLLVRKEGDSAASILSGPAKDQVITLHSVPDDNTAKMIACQKIYLPRILCVPWMIEQTIGELEQSTMLYFSEWQKSSWLKGELFLMLDASQSAALNGYRLTYSKADGLLYEKEEDKGA